MFNENWQLYRFIKKFKKQYQLNHEDFFVETMEYGGNLIRLKKEVEGFHSFCGYNIILSKHELGSHLWILKGPNGFRIYVKYIQNSNS